MKVLTKVIGLLFIVFAVTFFQAEPLQKRHHGPHKKHYRGHYKPKYKKVAYYRNGPKYYHKKHYYRPARPYKHYSHKRHPRVYQSRPVVIVNL